MMLSPAHLADLRSSGLSDQTIEAHRFRTIEDPDEIASILNWRDASAAAKLGPCMEIPFFDRDGQPTGFSRLKPTTPRPDGGKYEQPAGHRSMIYIPISVYAAAQLAGEILVVEGEKKALRIWQAGAPAIAICGVWNWLASSSDKRQRHGDKKRELIPELAEIIRGCRVGLVADGDDRRHESVSQAVAAFKIAVAEHNECLRR